MPKGYVLRIHPVDDNLQGYCECCGIWVSENDPEISACPQRYLSDHSMEWRYKVRAELEKQRPLEEDDLRAIHRRLRTEAGS